MCWARYCLLGLPDDPRNVRSSFQKARIQPHDTRIYQEYVAKSLTEKTNGLNHDIDQIVNQANAEIDMLNQRIESKSNSKIRRGQSSVYL